MYCSLYHIPFVVFPRKRDRKRQDKATKKIELCSYRQGIMSLLVKYVIAQDTEIKITSHKCNISILKIVKTISVLTEQNMKTIHLRPLTGGVSD